MTRRGVGLLVGGLPQEIGGGCLDEPPRSHFHIGFPTVKLALNGYFDGGRNQETHYDNASIERAGLAKAEERGDHKDKAVEERPAEQLLPLTGAADSLHINCCVQSNKAEMSLPHRRRNSVQSTAGADDKDRFRSGGAAGAGLISAHWAFLPVSTPRPVSTNLSVMASGTAAAASGAHGPSEKNGQVRRKIGPAPI